MSLRVRETSGASQIVGWTIPFLADYYWDQPEYYETIRFGDIDGDGQDELLARGPGGIQVFHFDKTLGMWRPQFFDPNAPPSEFNPDYNWQPMPPGPPLHDPRPNSTDIAWNQPQYYQTIRVGDIDGDGMAELIARSPTGIVAYKYYQDDSTTPATASWQVLASNTTPCPDSDAVGSSNPDGTAWTSPCYYDTIELAVLNSGDIGPGGHPLAYLVARAHTGLQVWRWGGSPSGWSGLGNNTGLMSDQGGYNARYYWQTAHYRDIDGDGLAELLVRTANGMAAYTWTPGSSPADDVFVLLTPGAIQPFPDSDTRSASNPDGTLWSSQTYYYGTIRLVDIDGDGLPELLGRGKNGVQAWRMTVTGGAISYTNFTLTDGEPAYNTFSDLNDWNHVQYASTIRTGLVSPDDDGPAGKPREYLLGRGAPGVQLWRWNPSGAGSSTGQWQTLGPLNPPWADNGLTNDVPGANANWQYPQYYNTIQLADVDGDGAVELLGRDIAMVETWKWLTPSGAEANWARTLAPFPTASSTTLTDVAQCYEFISQQLSGDKTNNIRSLYNEETATILDQWYSTLQGWLTTPPAHTPPINPSNPTWQAVDLQVLYEVGWAANVAAFLEPDNGLVQGWLQTTIGTKSGWLAAVNCQLAAENSSPESTTTVTIIRAIADAIWGLSDLVAPDIEPLVSAVFGMAAAGTVLLSLGDPSVTHPLVVTYPQLIAQLDLTPYTNELATFKAVVMQNYGLLRILGQAEWNDSVAEEMSNQAALGYRNFLWKTLTPLVWEGMGDESSGSAPPAGYPIQYSLTVPPMQGHPGGDRAVWFFLKGGNIDDVPTANALNAVFSTLPDTCVTPESIPGLGLSVYDAFYRLHGWQIEGTPAAPGGSVQSSSLVAGPASPRIDLEACWRRLGGGGFEVVLTVINRSPARLDSVEITAASMQAFGRRGAAPGSILSGQQHRLAPGRWATEYLFFPGLEPADSPTPPVLEVRGQFAGGTFTAQVPVRRPQ